MPAPDTPTDASHAPKGALVFIVLTCFIDMLGIGILIPVIPFMVRRFSDAAMTIGLLSGAFALFQFAAAPILGRLSDRHGRRPLLLLSLFGTAIGYFVFGAANTLAVMFVARIVDGITGGNISIAQAYIADVTPPADRSKNFGLVGAAFGLGFIIGPGLGGVLSHYFGISAPAFFSGGLALCNTAFGYFALPESLPPSRRTTTRVTIAQANPFPALIAALTHERAGRILLAIFAFNFAFIGLQSNFVLFSFQQFGWGPERNAMLFAEIGVLGAFMQGFVMRRIGGRFADKRLAITGLTGMACCLAAIAAAPAGWVLFPIAGVMSLSSGMATPTLTSMVSKTASAREQGVMLGVTQSVNSLTRISGPLWAGFAYDWFGRTSPYWTGALVIGVAIALVASTREGVASA
jgi:multidrug resistance protein